MPLLILALALLLLPSLARAGWSRPPPEVLAVLDAPELPRAWISPTREHLLLATPQSYPPLADLARPTLKLAGVRVDAGTRAASGESCYGELRERALQGGEERPVALPPGACLLRLRWSADGRAYALGLRAEGGMELWIGAPGEAPRRVRGLRLNPALGEPFGWMPDQRSLLVLAVPAELGPLPSPPAAPEGPRVDESGGATPSSTYEARDLLADETDARRFAWLAAAQLATVDLRGRVRPLGEPGLYAEATPSPDGQRLLVRRLREPLSRRVAWGRFAHDLELWDRAGRRTELLASLPAAEQVPIHGVPVGPRDMGWRPDAPATLVWLEALDGGDPGREAEHRDALMLRDLAGGAPARELYRAPHRLRALWWGEGGLLLMQEWERARRWLYTRALDADRPGAAARDLWDRSEKDRYADPGQPLLRTLPTGGRLLLEQDGWLYFAGAGASPEGDRPFLDRRARADGRAERLFQSEAGVLESVVDWAGTAPLRVLTRRESPSEPPNLHLRTLGDLRASTPITAFPDPSPALRAVERRLVTFTRADGVQLSFKLTLPPGYTPGTRLPTVLTAYPMEYSDAGTAGQITGSDRTFLVVRGASPLFLALSGYAVLSETSIPVIGDPDTAYDTFVEQVVSSAEAAVAKAVELGVTDPERVGVWGHSHGALMVATLLAHSDLFRAGIARSGAYNHTIRPFGFQNERRTLWQAKQTYLHLSPLLHADRIDEPLLLIHGAADQNPGTVPLQSEKLYEAVRGTGGVARLLMLPHELHGYVARESVEQVLAEQLAWMDRWVKNAAPRASKRDQGPP